MSVHVRRNMQMQAIRANRDHTRPFRPLGWRCYHQVAQEAQRQLRRAKNILPRRSSAVGLSRYPLHRPRHQRGAEIAHVPIWALSLVRVWQIIKDVVIEAKIADAAR